MAMGRMLRLIPAVLATGFLSGPAAAAQLSVRDQQTVVLNFDASALVTSGAFDLFIELEAARLQPGDVFGWQLCTARNGEGCTFPQLRMSHPGLERTFYPVASVTPADSEGEADGVFSLVLSGLSGTADVRVRVVVSTASQTLYLEPEGFATAAAEPASAAAPAASGPRDAAGSPASGAVVR